MDALLQVVHLVEVLAPLRVGDVEEHDALELAHHLGADGHLLALIGLEGLPLAPLGQRRGVLDVGQVGCRSLEREDLTQRGDQALAIQSSG